MLTDWFTGPSRWHQGPFSLGPAGNAVAIMDPEVVSLCLYAGTVRCNLTQTELVALFRVIERRFPDRIEDRSSPVRAIVCFNEDKDTTFSDVLSVIREFECESQPQC